MGSQVNSTGRWLRGLIVLVASVAAAQESDYTLRKFDFTPERYGFVKYTKTTYTPSRTVRDGTWTWKQIDAETTVETYHALVKKTDAATFEASGEVVIEDNIVKRTYTFLSNQPKGGYFIIPVQLTDAMALGIEMIGVYNRNMRERVRYAEAMVVQKDAEPWERIPDYFDAEARLVRPLSAGSNVVYEGQAISSATRDPMYSKTLNEVRTFFDADAEIELGKINNRWVAVVGIGEKKQLFAMYGVWESNAGLKYGFQVGEAVYPTENVPQEDCPAVAGLGISSKYSYGGICYSYDEIMENPEEIYPQLIWREELLTSRGTSQEPKEYTETEPRVLKPTRMGNYHPPAPDILDNTNPVPVRDCPDKDYYWELFCECAGMKLGQAGTAELTPESFYSYKDYMEVQMMKDNPDYTVYNEKGAYSSQVATPEMDPTEPYLFNKECDLLNRGTSFPFIAPWRAVKASLLGRRMGKTGLDITDLLLPGATNILWDVMWIKSGVIWDVREALDRVYKNVFPYASDPQGIQTLIDESERNFGSKADDYAKAIYELVKSGGQNLAIWDKQAGEGMENIASLDEIILIHKTTDADPSAFDELYVANPYDQNRPFNKGEYMATFDLNMARYGQPLRTFCFHKEERGIAEGSVYVQNDRKVWYIQFRWQIITRDEFGMPKQFGYLVVLERMFEEENKLLAPGQKQEWNHVEAEGTKPGDMSERDFSHSVFGGTSDAPLVTLNPRGSEAGVKINFLENDIDGEPNRNEFVYILGSTEADLPGWATYLKNSKNYHTDQYDISERDEDLDRGEALKEIALKIAVSEGLNLVMRGIHYVATEQNDNWVGKAATAAYETGKRLEGRMVQSKAAEIANKVYEAYMFWKRTMDVCNDLKNTYQNIRNAWDGLLYAIHNLKDYYKDFDITKLRLTNITSLYPTALWSMLDWNIHCLQSALSDFGKANHAMAYQIDKVSKGHYGPLVPVINEATIQLMEAQIAMGEQTEDEMKVLEKRINELEDGYGDNNRERAKLANLTREAHNLIVSQEWKVRNQATTALAQGLWLTESEAKDWVMLGTWMQHAFSVNREDRRDELAVALKNSKESRCAVPLLMEFRSPAMFNRVRGVMIEDMVKE